MKKQVPKKFKRDLTKPPVQTMEDLKKETIKLIRETNKRLEKLQRFEDKNKGRKVGKGKYQRKEDYYIISENGRKVKQKFISKRTYNSYSAKKLRDKLEVMNISPNRINIKKKMGKTDLKALNKALTNFIKSETSTKKGIKNVNKRNKERLKKDLMQDEFDTEMEEKIDNLDDEIVEKYFNMYDDDDFSYVLGRTGLTPSEFMEIMEYSRSRGHSGKQFLDELLKYCSDTSLNNDLDFKLACLRLYERLAS